MSVKGLLLVMACLGMAGCNLFVDADTYVDRGRAKLAAHDYRGAVIELKSALQSEPNHAPAHLGLAEALLALGDAAGAKAAAQRAGTSGAAPGAVAPLAAQAQLDLREYRELLTQLDSGALRLEPAEQSLYRGLARLGLGEVDAAIAAFNETLEREPGSLRARLGLAQAHVAERRPDLTNRALDAVLAADPGNARAWLIRGSLHAGRGEYEAAETALAKAQAQASKELPVPQRIGLLVMLTEVRLARGELNSARATQQQLAQLSGDAPLTRLLAGRLSLAEYDYVAAVRAFQQVLAAAPEFVVARFLLGSTLAAQGSLNQAEAELARVVEQAPDNLEARRLLARVRMRLDRADAALAVLEPAQTELEGSTLALGTSAPGDTVAGGPSQADRELQLEAARVHLANGDAQRAAALLQKMPPVTGDPRRERLLLTALIDLRGSSAAAAELDRWLEGRPRDPALLDLAAVFHAQRGDFTRARADIDAAIALEPANAGILLNAARIEHAGGNAAAATRHLEKLLTREPKHPGARMGLAELALRSGDLATAEQRLEAYRALDAKATAPRLLLAKVKLERREPAAADELLREALAAAPGNGTVRRQAGHVYAGAGRYDEAVAQFKVAAQMQPSNAGVWLDLARSQSALGQHSAARESLETALRQRSDWPLAVGALALLDLREGRREQAAQRAAELESRQPKDAAVAMMVGDVEMALANYSKAAAAYARAASLQPSAEAAVKAYRARRVGRLGDVARPLEEWLGRHPEDQTVRLLLAEAQQASGRTAQAIAEYERLAAARPTAAVLNNLAWAYQMKGDQRALEMAKRAYEMAPKTAAIVDTYGWIVLESGDTAAGARLLAQAVALDRNDPEIDYHYAVALHRRGEHTAAKSRLAALLDRPAFASQADARRLFDELSRGP